MLQPSQKPVIGFTCGDINGIGPELLLKTLSDHRLLELFTPLVFCSSKVINFYRKSIPELNLNFQNTKELNRINPKQINIFNCWEEEVVITPGQINEIGGKYALLSLTQATEALKDQKIQGLVTGPIHKKNTQSPNFKHAGHTPYFKEVFRANDVLMLMVHEQLRVALATEHIPLKDVAASLSKEKLLSKLNLLNQSLIRDFGIDKPKLAVLGLNPHAGDEGLVGKEEEELIRPVIKEAKHSMMVFGPYAADGFFAHGQFQRFDGILALYHDQGLIPFKTMAEGGGVNYTAGLPVVRTSPDHGPAFDIAGKNKADTSSFLQAIYTCLDILSQRFGYADNRKNPLKKYTSVLLANAADERIEEGPES
ncbi:MAG: 4-hydroxythreonine-4-phosphate dehydrogenase PdxA [Chitinophagaceae bacterium]